MSDEEKKQVIKEKKHFDYFFSTKFNIRNRKRKEKKKPFPHTPYKDKAEKERESRKGERERGKVSARVFRILVMAIWLYGRRHSGLSS
jgi:hypothetical protein